jgi:manganese efflux pump family protein
MQLYNIFLIAFGLSMDAFAVSIGAGASGRALSKRAAFRMSFHFGLFQFIMPVIGWFVGQQITRFFSAIDHWLAFGLLAFVGVRMIYESCKNSPECLPYNPSRGWNLVLLSLATSIDALAVGMSLAMLRINIWYPSALIGIITATLSLVGILMGGVAGSRFGKRAEVAGGIVMLAIGFKILINHF